MQDLAMFANTLTATNLLLDNSRQTQEVKRREVFNPNCCCMKWAKELCTVKTCGPRRTGHSHVARQLFSHYFKGDAWVIVPKMEMLKEFREECGARACSMVHLEKHRGTARLSAVIIDTASLFSRNEIEKIYCDFCPYVWTNARNGEPFFFVFLE